jgi:hypothetical protein
MRESGDVKQVGQAHQPNHVLEEGMGAMLMTASVSSRWYLMTSYLMEVDL